MSTNTPAASRNKYDKFTESCPKMTRRWRRDVIPELAAWLAVHRTRIERQKLHADQAAQAARSDELRAVGAKLQVRLDVLDELMRTLPDKWNDYLWWEVAVAVDELIGPIPSKPNFNPRIPGTVAQPIPQPDVTDATTRRGDAGSDHPPVDRKDQRRRRRV